MKYLAIDYGKKNIGLAISDSKSVVAMPYAILQNSNNFLNQLKEIIQKEQIEAIVFGESKNFLGQDNYINLEIKKKAEEVKEEFSLPVHFINEVFTSMESKWGIEKNIRRTQKNNRKSKKEQRIDDKAATMILKTFLEKKKGW